MLRSINDKFINVVLLGKRQSEISFCIPVKDFQLNQLFRLDEVHLRVLWS